jgi:hypothetical protein
MPALHALALLGVACGGGPALAADAPPVAVELNKLEPLNKGCRAYFVVTNSSDAAFQAVKLDLIFFRQDGIIDRRLALDVGPVRPNKRGVKSFDLDLPCEGIGSILANDVLDCHDAAGPVADCLGRLQFSSRASATLAK